MSTQQPQQEEQQITPENYAAQNVNAVVSVINKELANQVLLPGYAEHQINAVLNKIFNDVQSQEEPTEGTEKFIHRVIQMVAMFPSVVRSFEALEAYKSDKSSLEDVLRAAATLKSAEHLFPLKVEQIEEPSNQLVSDDASLRHNFETLLRWTHKTASERFSEEKPYGSTFAVLLTEYIANTYENIVPAPRYPGESAFIVEGTRFTLAELLFSGLTPLHTSSVRYTTFLTALTKPSEVDIDDLKNESSLTNPSNEGIETIVEE